MSCIVRRAAARGARFVEPVHPAPADFAEAARRERPGGVYAAFGVRRGRRVIRLTDHLDRFEDSARRLGFELALDRELVRREICDVLREARIEDARVRLSAHPEDRTAEGKPILTVAAEPYAGPPPELRARGVACRTVPHGARTNPRAKQTRWIADRERLDERTRLTSGSALASGPGLDAAADAGAAEPPYEWLLLDDEDRILEGASSNFYAMRTAAATAAGAADHVPEEPRLWTAGEGVLHGIARSIVLEVAPAVVTVVLEAPRYAQIGTISEAFLTSASRGIVPVVRIDDTMIGDGAPGPLTRELIVRYDRLATELEEPLCD
jgi:branched-chain amino acid aminotransferase